MANISELENALTKAHQAGDTKSASIFANQIKQQRSSGPTGRDVDSSNYSITKESVKALGTGVLQPFVSAMGGLSTVAMEQMDQLIDDVTPSTKEDKFTRPTKQCEIPIFFLPTSNMPKTAIERVYPLFEWDL